MIPFYKDDTITIVDKVKKTLLLNNQKLAHVFSQLDDNELKAMFDIYDNQMKWRAIHLIEHSKQLRLINEMPHDELVDLIQEFEADKDFIISKLDIQKRQRIELLLSYRKTFAGSMMSEHFIIAGIEESAGVTLKKVIHHSDELAYIDTIFIENNDKVLVGRISLTELVIARKNTLLKNCMKPILMKIYPESDLIQTIDFMMDYDKESVPVLNHQGTMIGLITAEDVLQEVADNFDEDFKSFASISNIESYDSGFKRYVKRIPWLLIALVFNIMVASILKVFEPTLASVSALIIFQPLISGMSGNLATQALAVTLLKEETLTHIHIKKELLIGFFNGMILSILTFILAYIVLLNMKYGSFQSLSIATQVSLSLWITMSIAAAIGVFIPITLKKIGKNPALASGPLITTLNDLFALTIYFSIATLFL